MSKTPKIEELRQQLMVEEARLEALLKPARETYDRLMNAPELLEAKRVIKEVSAQLAPVKNELAVLARAGGAKTLHAEAGALTASTVKGI